MKKLARFIRILEYTGTEEFIAQAVTKRYVKKNAVFKNGSIKEAVCGDFVDAVNLFDESQPTTVTKPCPFCGGRNIHYEVAASQGYYICKDCKTCGPEVSEAADPECSTEAAAQAWNTRKGV